MFVVSFKCVFGWTSHSSSVSLLQCWRPPQLSHRHVDRDDKHPESLSRPATGRTIRMAIVSKHNKERHL